MANLRRASASDATFLAEMLALATDWQPGANPRPVAAILADPQLARYVTDWPRSGDLGVIATNADVQPIGAAWFRYFDAAEPGFGFVSATVPEVSIAVVPVARGAGTGRQMLIALVDAARTVGVTRLSLSVEQDNPARHLYERLGFTAIRGTGGSVTMVSDLEPAGSNPSGGPDWT